MIKKVVAHFIFVLIIGSGLINQASAQVSAKKLSETEKIDALINYVSGLDATFIRNGEEHTAKKAAEHLAYKYKKSSGRVNNAKDFIDILASKSSITDKPYQIKYKNGSVINARDVLYNQLRKLEQS